MHSLISKAKIKKETKMIDNRVEADSENKLLFVKSPVQNTPLWESFSLLIRCRSLSFFPLFVQQAAGL